VGREFRAGAALHNGKVSPAVKIGLILECQRDGPDEKVFKELFARFASHHTLSIEAAGNKRNLVEECGKAAQRLIETDGCDRVLIIWDLRPASWGDALEQANRKPCLKEDRTKVFAALDTVEGLRDKCVLVAIDAMLESLFLADKNALVRALNKKKPRTPITKQDIGNVKSSKITEPKKHLEKLYENQGLTRYADHTDALLITQEIMDIDDLIRNCASFARLWERANEE
jgi:hypothetical protein